MEKTVSPLKVPALDFTSSRAEALTQVFDSYHQRIYNYLRFRVGSPQEAEELASHVFEKVLRKFGTYRAERGPFEVWLFAIARRVVADHYRQREKKAWLPLEKLRDLASPEPGPEETAVKAEYSSSLAYALSTLGSREREVVAMKFAAKLKNREIAVLMDLSESNVGVILHRTLSQLRDVLKGVGYYE